MAAAQWRRWWAASAAVGILATGAIGGEPTTPEARAEAPVPVVVFDSAPLIVRSARSQRVSGADVLGGERLLATTAAEKREAMGGALVGKAAAEFFGVGFTLPSGQAGLLETHEDDCFNLWDVDATDVDDERDMVLLTFDVRSVRSQDAVLAVGCNGGFAIFVDGRACYARLPNGGYGDSSNLVMLPLREGDNRVTLLARTSARRGTRLYAPEWVTKIRIFPDRASALTVHLRHNRHPFTHPIVSRLEELRAVIGAPFARQVEIRAGDRSVAEGEVMADGTITWAKRVDGAEGVMLASIDGIAAEPIVVCTPDRLETLNVEQPAEKPDPHAMIRSAWRWRFKHLLKPDNRAGYERKWAQKFALSCHGMLHPDQIPALPRSKVSSLGIGAYKSAMDGATQYYEYFVPRRALASEGRGEPIPLLIVLPSVADPVRPFLESYYLADIQEMEAWAAVAEEHGYALLWPGYVDVDFGGALTQRSLAESIQQFRAARHMEVGRIYLMGVCSSGVAATRALFEGDYEIGGVCLYSPLVRRSKHRVVHGMRPFTPVRLPEALPDRSIDEIARRLAKVPVAMLYDSGMPGHGSRAHAYQLLEACRNYGGDMVELKARTVAEYTWGERMKYRLGLFSKWLVAAEARRDRATVQGDGDRPDGGGVRDLLIEGFRVGRQDDALAAWMAGWEERYFQWRGAELPRERGDQGPRISTVAIASAEELGPELAGRLREKNIDASADELFGIVRTEGDPGEVLVFRNLRASGTFPAVDPILDGYFAGALWRRETGRWTQIDAW